MKTQINKSSLKQARKNADIPLTTMAEILSMDTSNLSKYERGIKTPTSYIVLCYHLLTQSSLSNLWNEKLTNMIQFLKDQVSEKIEKLEQEHIIPVIN